MGFSVRSWSEESFEAEGGPSEVVRGLNGVGTMRVESCEAEGKSEVELVATVKEESLDAVGILAVEVSDLPGGVQLETEESRETEKDRALILA